MQQHYPAEFEWLARLARDVNQQGGFYTNQETAAIYCPTCQTIQAYCTGCGKKLIDVYNEVRHDCENCGISLSHCQMCGDLLEEETTAPEDIQPPEYWKYCPACGEAVFAVTDMCPHCKISMGTHLDRVYEETYQQVSHAVVEEENVKGAYWKSKHPPLPLNPDNKPQGPGVTVRFLLWLAKKLTKLNP